MDHDRVNMSASPMSCGILELSRISPEIDEVLYAIGSRLYYPAGGDPYAMIVWSDLNSSVTSGEFQGKIRAFGFGIVDKTPFTENPKTGNIIAMWYWVINHDKFKTWYKKERIAKLGKVGT